jgi:hypothetical protein
MSEPEERNLLGHQSRRVKGAAAHLEVPAGIILPAKSTVTTHIGSGQSRFLRRCVEVREFDAFVARISLPEAERVSFNEKPRSGAERGFSLRDGC